MTRIFTDGAEMRDSLFFTVAGAGLTVTSTDPAPAFSGYCYRVNNPGHKDISAISEGYLRERLWFSDPSFYSTSWRLPSFRTGITDLVWMTFDVTNHPTANSPAGVLATSATACVKEQWYLWELYVKIADNPSGRVVLYMDGTKVIDFTGDTLTGAYTTFDNIEWISGGGSSYAGLDDIAFNDTNGGSDNSYCGDGVIIKVTPDGNGTHNNWHGSDSDDTDNYLLVDEYPKDDDTTYVYHDGSSSGTQDQYALSDYDGTGKTILRIYPEARIRKTSAAAHTVKLGTLASGGTDAMSAAMNLSTVYARYVGNEQTVNPVDSGAWEEADIDALQFVVEVG